MFKNPLGLVCYNFDKYILSTCLRQKLHWKMSATSRLRVDRFVIDPRKKNLQPKSEKRRIDSTNYCSMLFISSNVFRQIASDFLFEFIFASYERFKVCLLELPLRIFLRFSVVLLQASYKKWLFLLPLRWNINIFCNFFINSWKFSARWWGKF